MALFNPLITYAVALCVFPDEHMVLTQWIGAALLLLGTLLVVYAGRRNLANGRKPAPPRP